MPTATFESVRIDTRAFAETFVKNATHYGEVKTAYLPLSLLYVNEDYQRKPQSHINKIAANFDENKCGFLLVSYDKPRGGFSIVDGQHRYLAAKQAGVQNLPCQILENIDSKQEALVFAAQNENVVRISVYDKFRARVFAGDPTACAVKRICNSYGISTRKQNKQNEANIKSLELAEKIYSIYGESGLRWVLEIIQNSGWNLLHGAYGSNVLTAMKNIYQKYSGAADEVAVILPKMLRPLTPDLVEAKAKLKYVSHGPRAAMFKLLDDMLADKVILTIEEGEC